MQYQWNGTSNKPLKVKGTEATMACQDDQLCAGLKAGIYGLIHGVQTIWNGNLSME